MSSPELSAAEHRVPHAARANIISILFSVFAGPAAWFVQLCAGYALASAPCFNAGERLSAPVEALRWTAPAMIAIMIGAVTAALISLALSRSALNAINHEHAAGARDVSHPGVGRARFLAQWGVALGAGFAVATVVTAFGFMVLPRCAG